MDITDSSGRRSRYRSSRVARRVARSKSIDMLRTELAQVEVPTRRKSPRNRSTRRSRPRPDEEHVFSRPARQPSSGRKNFSDPARPFDERGRCLLHRDVRMAKKRRQGGWKILVTECPECLKLDSESSTESLSSCGSSYDDGDDTSTSRTRQGGRPRCRHRDGANESTAQNVRSIHRRPARLDREGYEGRPSESTSRRHSRRDRSVQSRRSHRSDRLRHEGDCNSQVSGRSRGGFLPRRRDTGKTNRRRQQQQQPRPSKHDGAPFDHKGRCFFHPRIKLASKKILGGWKIHLESCPLCEDRRCRPAVAEDGHSVLSGVSRLTDGSRCSDFSSNRSSAQQSIQSSGQRSVASWRSFKSIRSNASTSTWVSNQDKKRISRAAGESFLPLDEDGFCEHHPGVRIAKKNKRGHWKVLLDFCPECAANSLAASRQQSSRVPVCVVGPDGERWTGRAPTRRRPSDRAASVQSGRSGKSSGSASTYVEAMPYVDYEGSLGHYTGHVTTQGHPNGRGKIDYIDGSEYEGLFHEGTKVHGRKSKGAPVKTSSSSLPLPRRGGSRAANEHREKGSRRDGGRRRGLSRLRQKCDEIEELLRAA